MYQGAHLASVHSEDENEFIYNSYQAEAGDGDIWIGGIKKGDSYSWLDGTPWNYQNWSPGNPSGGSEKCSEIFALNYYPSKWNDDNCELAKNAFVCQLPSTISWNGNCVRDSEKRLLPTLPGNDLQFPSNTPARCMEACDDQGFLFAGVQHGHECWCGNDAPPQDRIVDMKECVHSCSGDSTLKCGGVWRMNVYKIEGETNQGIVWPRYTKI